MVLSGNVMAEEVYYCSDIDANGFRDANGKYIRAGFNNWRFKMKLGDDGNITIENPDIPGGKHLFLCSMVFDGHVQRHKTHKTCVSDMHGGYLFNFNPDNGRYVWFQGFGYAFDNGDSVSTRIGTCTKF